MPERYSEHEIDDEQDTLEEKLNMYYGPDLSEQLLPASSWLHLSSQLPPHRPGRPWLRPKWRFTRRATQTLPFDIQERLVHIAFQANMLNVAQNTQCTFKRRVDVPFVSVSLFKKRAIQLILPPQRRSLLSQAELDVLLASGVARYKYMHRLAYALPLILLSTLLFTLLLAIALVLVIWRNISAPVVLSAFGSVCVLTIALFWFLSSQVRRIARQADVLVVRWIGRDQTCRGLHALAARSHAPSHKKWGELSLDERIHAVCHTPVAVEDERFTLVR